MPAQRLVNAVRSPEVTASTLSLISLSICASLNRSHFASSPSSLSSSPSFGATLSFGSISFIHFSSAVRTLSLRLFLSEITCLSKVAFLSRVSFFAAVHLSTSFPASCSSESITFEAWAAKFLYSLTAALSSFIMPFISLIAFSSSAMRLFNSERASSNSFSSDSASSLKREIRPVRSSRKDSARSFSAASSLAALAMESYNLFASSLATCLSFIALSIRSLLSS